MSRLALDTDDRAREREAQRREDGPPTAADGLVRHRRGGDCSCAQCRAAYDPELRLDTWGAR